MNGKVSTKIFIFIVGGLAAFFCTVVFFIGNNVIANDKASRNRDVSIKEKLETKIENNQKEIYEKLTQIQKEQSDNFKQISVALAKLETKIENDE